MRGTLAELGEFGLIERITQDLVTGPQVVLGPGDDAAVVSVDGGVVVSTDAMNENVHFRTDWVAGEDVGHRCIGRALADIEAMGATPTAVVIALSTPETTTIRWIERFTQGVMEECETAHVSLVGGDVSRAEMISVAVTAIGQTGGRAVITRSGAQIGDTVALKGRLGWAAAGLAVLSRGFRSPRAVVSAYQRPRISYGAGVEAGRHQATSMIDVSDGLIADLRHIATASGVLINIETNQLPLPEPLQTLGHATGKDPLELVLTGGEDHGFVATFPEGRCPRTWQPIGQVLALDGSDPGVLVDGKEWLKSPGWTHF
ncbi:MAG: thiamine-phosphate kinase [Propionibacteriaceae bacterium]|jgi:thiamine-monophosphate kinase|nr:thiamine-phosphate kinase [Propionibacteriaceae bacterium]